ncbi:MAG TPA: GYF domain-containing protein [Tepidisphaeraceae bacterium]
MPQALWYYMKNGRQQGPLDAQTLKQLAVSGQIGLSDMVWKQGMAEWLPASRVRGLIPEARPAAVAAPPSPPPIAVEDRTKPCPFCGEQIKASAIKCRFCGEMLESRKTAEAVEETLICPNCGGSFPMSKMDRNGLCKTCASPQSSLSTSEQRRPPRDLVLRAGFILALLFAVLSLIWAVVALFIAENWAGALSAWTGPIFWGGVAFILRWVTKKRASAPNLLKTATDAQVAAASTNCLSLFIVFVAGLAWELIYIAATSLGASSFEQSRRGTTMTVFGVIAMFAGLSILGGAFFSIIYLPLRWTTIMSLPTKRKAMGLVGAFGLIFLLLVELIVMLIANSITPRPTIPLNGGREDTNQSAAAPPVQRLIVAPVPRPRDMDDDPIVTRIASKYPEMLDDLKAGRHTDLLDSQLRLAWMTEQITYEEYQHVQHYLR